MLEPVPYIQSRLGTSSMGAVQGPSTIALCSIVSAVLILTEGLIGNIHLDVGVLACFVYPRGEVTEDGHKVKRLRRTIPLQIVHVMFVVVVGYSLFIARESALLIGYSFH